MILGCADGGGDGGVPIDASSELFDGTKINGVADLRQALLRYSPQFVRSVTERLMSYGIGRGVQYYDMPAIREIVREAALQQYRLSSLILGVARSAAFQSASADKTDSPAASSPREAKGRAAPKGAYSAWGWGPTRIK